MKSWSTKASFSLFFIACLNLSGFGKAHFNFNSESKQAYKQAFSANYSGSIATSSKQIASGNLCGIYTNALARFLDVTFAGNESEDKKLVEFLSQQIDILDDAPNHEFAGFAKGELSLFEAISHLRLGESFSAALAMRRAYNYLEDNLENYPNFKLAQKSLCMVQALLSKIPSSYKGIVEFMGYETDISVALTNLNDLSQSLINNETYGGFKNEVEIYRGIIMLKLTQKFHEGFDIIKQATNDYKNNVISCYVRGKLALDSKRTNEAIEILSIYAGPNSPIGFINYEIANAYLYKLDKKASLYYSYFIRNSKGLILLKDTYLRLAWDAYLKGLDDNVKSWLKLIETQTTSNHERDETAVKEAKTFYKTDKTLLTVRLHFDGGFYEYALNILQKDQERLLKSNYTRIRYYYQSARLYQDMNMFNEAIINFKLTVNEPFIENEYLVPVSYFNMGIIYEEHLHKKPDAIQAYTRCLEFSNYPYESSYKYRSKMALKRLK
ncbi:MAG: hypothetical protein KDC92_16940 [Bacteroidetes bacterium]|nr:hypothetical protein [Bacteroidota bacterium]